MSAPERRKISVVVPVAPLEEAWTRLALDLGRLPAGSEVIFVGPRPPRGMPEPGTSLGGAHHRVAWVRSGWGRAKQLNAGAKAARGDFLWFLHADSRFDVDTLARLERSLAQAPAALHYFDLAFLPDGPPLTAVNALGTWVRSHALGMPFGDQGLCIGRAGFEAVGGFPEGARYGEDHLFVWKAGRLGLELRCTGAKLYTSARKYRDRGWLNTTVKHLYLTYKQALPELVSNLRARGRT